VASPLPTAAADASSSTAATRLSANSLELSDEELELIIIGLDRKIWSLDQAGLSDKHPRKIQYKNIRDKIKREQVRRLAKKQTPGN
jgi:hypothetical protein